MLSVCGPSAGRSAAVSFHDWVTLRWSRAFQMKTDIFVVWKVQQN